MAAFFQKNCKSKLKLLYVSGGNCCVHIQSASRYYLQTEIDILLSYSPEKLVDYFKDAANTLDSEKCVICADLLYEFALICEAKDYKEAAQGIKTSCLHLYKTVVPKEAQFQKKLYLERMAVLVKELEEAKNLNLIF
jgi:hypothetical protein